MNNKQEIYQSIKAYPVIVIVKRIAKYDKLKILKNGFQEFPKKSLNKKIIC